jgi:uncharacterized protein
MKSIIPHGSVRDGERHVVRIEDGAELGSEIRVASGFGSRLRGLLGTRSLPAGQGLLLVPCTSIHMFFMAIPLDVAFLDADGCVVSIYKFLKPWRMSRLHPEAFAALELPAGTFEAVGLKVGDRLGFTPAPSLPEITG